VITGFNTDIRHNDKVFHIQTEDKGLQNPYIESLVYVGGEILASKKTSYADQLKAGIDEKWIGGLMEQQHRTMIAAIKRGRLDQPGESTESRKASEMQRKTIAQTDDTEAAAVEIDRTLDQVIIDYLASEAESEHLELAITNHGDFISGQMLELRIAAKRSLSQQPIAGAAVEVKVISTVDAPQVLYRGKTNTDGVTLVRCAIPIFDEGTAAIIISAQSALGNDEIKQLVKRRK
jgi:hypothetical protein